MILPATRHGNKHTHTRNIKDYACACTHEHKTDINTHTHTHTRKQTHTHTFTHTRTRTHGQKITPRNRARTPLHVTRKPCDKARAIKVTVHLRRGLGRKWLRRYILSSFFCCAKPCIRASSAFFSARSFSSTFSCN